MVELLLDHLVLDVKNLVLWLYEGRLPYCEFTA
jgi:hypothetical protein